MGFTDFVAATSWRGPRGWCCATSPMPTARCARPCPRRTAPPSSTPDRPGWARRSGRPTPRSSTSGRRSRPGARRPGPGCPTRHRLRRRPLSQQERAFTVMIRNAMFARVAPGLARRPRRADAPRARGRRPTPTRQGRCKMTQVALGRGDRGLLRRARQHRHRLRRAWSPAARHRARGGTRSRLRTVRQTIADPAGTPRLGHRGGRRHHRLGRSRSPGAHHHGVPPAVRSLVVVVSTDRSLRSLLDHR